ncbi:DUF4019 domain-containing protein [Novosphingobium sp. MW5]|nr:DUF4019 domain-containing protein [Novosphingobium sp. MW5]
MQECLEQLSEKEKQTLRLLLGGHDAKSSARELGLSVHTINERLRDARRKLGVSSSREAARRLRDAEALAPQSFGDEQIGDAPKEGGAEHATSDHGKAARGRGARILAGGVLMSLVFALYALSSFGTLPTFGTSAVSEAAAQAEVEQSARSWLALVDAGKWNESWSATGTSFQRLNSAKVWASVSDKVRAPLGAVTSRKLVSSEEVPAPPAGYTMVKFRTDFAGKAGAVETLTLVREAGGWKVTGYIIG